MKRLLALALTALLFPGMATAADVTQEKNCVNVFFPATPDRPESNPTSVTADASPTFRVRFEMLLRNVDNIPWKDCPLNMDLENKHSDDLHVILVDNAEVGDRIEIEQSLRSDFIDIVKEGELDDPPCAECRGKDGSVWAVQKDRATLVQYVFPSDMRDKSLSELYGDSFTFAVVTHPFEREDGTEIVHVVGARQVSIEGSGTTDGSSGDDDGAIQEDTEGNSGSTSTTATEPEVEEFGLTIDISCSNEGFWDCEADFTGISFSFAQDSSGDSEEDTTSSGEDTTSDDTGTGSTDGGFGTVSWWQNQLN